MDNDGLLDLARDPGQRDPNGYHYYDPGAHGHSQAHPDPGSD